MQLAVIHEFMISIYLSTGNTVVEKLQLMQLAFKLQIFATCHVSDDMHDNDNWRSHT